MFMSNPIRAIIDDIMTPQWEGRREEGKGVLGWGLRGVCVWGGGGYSGIPSRRLVPDCSIIMIIISCVFLLFPSSSSSSFPLQSLCLYFVSSTEQRDIERGIEGER